MYRSHMTPSVLACFVCNLESFQPPSCLEKLWIFCLVDRSGSLLWRVWSLKGSPCFWAAAALEGQPTAWVQWMCIFLRFGQTILVEMIHEPGLLPQNQWDVLPFLPESWKWKMGPSHISFLSFRVIFHFHDYGRKGRDSRLFYTVDTPCLMTMKAHTRHCMWVTMQEHVLAVQLAYHQRHSRARAEGCGGCRSGMVNQSWNPQ